MVSSVPLGICRTTQTEDKKSQDKNQEANFYRISIIFCIAVSSYFETHFEYEKRQFTCV